MKKILVLALALLAPGVFAAQQLTCSIDGFANPNDYVDVEIIYPLKGQTLYQVKVTGWDDTTNRELVIANYDGVGKLDRRMLDGKLTLLYPGTQAEAGKIWFIEPEDQEVEPKTGKIIGRERKMQVGSPTPFELESCYLTRNGPL